MILQPGARFGQYEILAQIGAGGMGEVYRARDNTLGRDVAIKVLGANLLPDPGRDARFEREARLLASLNHPHIGAIYGLERFGEIRGLVLELVEGPTLQERMERGRLPLDETLKVAQEVAKALEAAHAKGIVHRDLKPGNIKLAGAAGVKVLDFGLAVAVASPAAAAELATVSVTGIGVVAGTAPYMSPEQARGEATDSRTDIWAFGCILYEMLAGRRAFSGRTVSDIIVSVLTQDPDWSALPSDVPVVLRRLVRRCLARDARLRLHSIADARLDLDDVLSSTDDATPGHAVSSKRPRWRSFVGLTAGALALVGMTWFAATRFGGRPGVATVSTVFGIDEPPGESIYRFVDPIVLSPDGRRVTMITNSTDGLPRLWIRSLDAITPDLVDGSEGAMFPFWSADGRSVAFNAGGQLKIADLTNRSIRALAPAAPTFGGGAWNREGLIVLARGIGEGLGKIPAAGGKVESLTSIDKARGEVFHAFPQFLPDQRHFLFFSQNVQRNEQAVLLGDLQSSTIKRVLTGTSRATYASPGYLLYERGGQILAQRFDVGRGEVEGDAAVVVDRTWSIGAFSVTDTGTLAFVTRRTPITKLTWVERTGRTQGTIGEPSEWVHVAISPDERKVAAERLDARTGSGAIWLLNVSQNVFSRFAPGADWNFAPAWSPDSSRIVFCASRVGAADLYMKALNASDDHEVFISSELKQPNDVLADGTVVFTRVSNKGAHIWCVRPGGGQPPRMLGSDAVNETTGKVSPDGRWLAYCSNQSGRREVYVRAYDEKGGRTQVSAGGGDQPRWRRDGKELFFLADDGTIMAASVTTGTTFSAEPAQPLLIKTERDVTGGRYTYDVADLGKRFLVNRAFGADPAPAVTVILNWQARLPR